MKGIKILLAGIVATTGLNLFGYKYHVYNKTDEPLDVVIKLDGGKKLNGHLAPRGQSGYHKVLKSTGGNVGLCFKDIAIVQDDQEMPVGYINQKGFRGEGLEGSELASYMVASVTTFYAFTAIDVATKNCGNKKIMIYKNPKGPQVGKKWYEYVVSYQND